MYIKHLFPFFISESFWLEASTNPHRRAPLGLTSLSPCFYRWVFPPQSQPLGFLFLRGEAGRDFGWGQIGRRWSEAGRDTPCLWQMWVGASRVSRVRSSPKLRPRAGPRLGWGGACRHPGQDTRGSSAWQYFQPNSHLLCLSCPPQSLPFIPSTPSSQAIDARTSSPLLDSGSRSWLLGSSM